MDDWKQLETYARTSDERAFAVLVRRYVNLVHSAAYRQLGDRAAAEDVTQTVFVLLARKARNLKPTGSLGAWLYRVACMNARTYQKKEVARKRREQQAMEVDPTEEASNWESIGPVLDDAMLALSEKDREALVLRFFEKQALGEVGNVLGISEDAARKRVARALERLRSWFAKRGIQCTANALGTYAVLAAPDALAQRVVEHVTLKTCASSGLLASMKAPLLGVFLVSASIPPAIGYFSPSPLAAVANEITERPEPPAAATSAFIAAWEALKTANETPAQIDGAIGLLPAGYRKRAFQALLIAEWCESDPAAALRHFLKKEDAWREFDDVWKTCLRQDGKKAAALIASEPITFKKYLRLLLSDIATVAPEYLPQLTPHMPMRYPGETTLFNTFTNAARADLSTTRRLLDSLEGETLLDATAGVAKAWAETDGPAALAWVQALEPSEIRGRALQTLLEGWAKSDPIAALEHLHLAPEGGGYGFTRNTAYEVMDVAARENLTAVLAWLPEHQEIANLSGLIVGIISRLEEMGPENALPLIENHPMSLQLAEQIDVNLASTQLNSQLREWINQRPRTEFTAALRKQVLSTIEAPQSLDWINEMIRDGKTTQKDLEQFAGFYNLDFPNLDHYIDRAEPAMRTALFSTFVPRIASRDIDLSAWDTYLTEMDGDLQVQAATALGQNRAKTNPQAALQWSESLPEPELRNVARESILIFWQETDRTAYLQWKDQAK